MLKAQTAEYLNEDFYWADKDTIAMAKMKFRENGNFEFIIDNLYDCTPTYQMYGKGHYNFHEDSIHLSFDSIPTLQSSSNIDSIKNDDKIVRIQINVVDEKGINLNGLNLSWGKPKKRWGWITTKFFDKAFDKETILELKINKELNYMRIEKEGYYWGNIKLPKKPNKDYMVEVILRPKPKTKSFQYFSNEEINLKVISECEIQFNNELILKKESCH